MTCTELVAEAERRTQEQTERIRAKLATFEEAAWEKISPGSDWSTGPILEHMIISNESYLPTLETAVASAARGGSGSEARTTLFGRMLTKAAGPDGNAPAPKAMRPPPGPVDRDAVSARWYASQERFAKWLESVRDVDLTRTKIRNPLVPIFRMNLTDCIMVLVEHTERHVRQIEGVR